MLKAMPVCSQLRMRNTEFPALMMAPSLSVPSSVPLNMGLEKEMLPNKDKVKARLMELLEW